jgi:hypothetical protein
MNTRSTCFPCSCACTLFHSSFPPSKLLSSHNFTSNKGRNLDHYLLAPLQRCEDRLVGRFRHVPPVQGIGFVC